LVLLDLADELNARVLEDVTGHPSEHPEEQIHVLVYNVFIKGAVSPVEMGMVREIVALSTHRPELHQRLNLFYDEMRAYVEDLFSRTSRHDGLTASEAADIACALWMGLLINIEFDDRLDDAVARRLFRRTLLSLASLDGARGGWGDRPSSKRKSKSVRPAPPGS
jgi:hypothetical protein